MVQTAGVVEVKVTASAEVAVAVRVGVELKLWVPGLVKVMVWDDLGVTEFEAEEAGLVPIAFVAVTVKV